MVSKITQNFKMLVSMLAVLLAGQAVMAQGGMEVTSPAGVAGTYYGAASFFSGVFSGEAGELVVPMDTSGTPEFGCYPFTNDLTGKIALIDRGACAFAIKGINAQNAGAIGVIVCNSVVDGLPFQMLGSPGLDIPVLMLSKADCDLIKTGMPGVEATLLEPSANENCVTGSVITDGTYTNGDLLTGFGSVFSGASHGTWYKYTAANDGLLTISSCDGGANSRLIVIPGSDCGEVSNNVLGGNYYVSVDDCDDGSGNEVAAGMSIIALGGTTYNIHWDNAQDSTGFDFTVGLDPLPALEATFTVDMSQQSVSADGVHFVWADPYVGVPLDTVMEDQGNGLWSITLPFTALDTIGYFFSNGLANNVANFEIVPAACGVDAVVVPGFYVRPFVAGLMADPNLVCFGSCDPCPPPSCSNPAAIFCDDVENYSLGSVSAQSALWSPWTGGASAEVSDEQASSGSQSVKVAGGGSVDQLLLLGDSTAGNYNLSWKLYVPAGNGAYFNVQKFQDNPGGEYGMQIDLAPDGTATLDAGAAAATSFSYPQGAWFDVVLHVDLDNDIARLSVAGEARYEWNFSATTFSTAPSAKQLGSINFYPIDASYVFYVDDVEFVKLQPQDCNPDAIICDGFEWYAEGSRTGPQAAYWSTWSGSLGGNDDGLVTTEQAADGNNSMVIQEGQTQDVLLLLGNRTEGHYLLRWDMYLPAGKTGYFNVQESETPGVAWNLEVFLNRNGNNAGTGELDGLGVTFTYPEDQWFTVVHEIDLDNDWFEMWVDGAPVGALDYTGSLGGINFFSIDASNRYYLDNVELIALPSCLEDAIICDPIEAYPAGSRTGTQADYWATWSGAVGGADDGLVSTDVASSGDNSVLIAEGQTQDVLLLLGNRADGRYELSWKMYMPANRSGYYNIQQSETPGVAWNLEVSFGADNLGNPTAFGQGLVNQSSTTFDYAEDSWLDIVHVVDLDEDQLTISINGTEISTIAYTGNLGAVNFFSINADNRYYLDDILFRELPPVVQPVNVTFNVDAQLLIDNGALDASGLWIAGSFNGFVGEQMTDNGDGTYTLTKTLDPSTQYTYKFQNGQGNWESIDLSQGPNCTTGSYADRFVDTGTDDLVLDMVCYSYCIACDEVVSIDEVTFAKSLDVYPNPAQTNTFISYEFPEVANLTIQLVNNLGQVVQLHQLDGVQAGAFDLNLSNVPSGFYTIRISDGNNQFTEKLVIEK